MRSKRAVSTRMLAFSLLTISCVALPAAAQAQATVTALLQETHIHGLAVDRTVSNGLLIATHHGLYAAGSDGKAERISPTRDDMMGFTVLPSDPTTLFASGHPVAGGNLGFITSPDGGRSWTKLSNGVGGPVDFHQMDVSKADSQVVYGIYRVLQRSIDGGAINAASIGEYLNRNIKGRYRYARV